MRRYAIYFFYDKDGIVDRYVLYFLEKLKPYIQYLVFISGVKLNPSEKRKLINSVDEIYECEHETQNANAYKLALEKVDSNLLSQYDEILLLDYTIWGPVISFQQLFETTKTYNLSLIHI